MHRIIFIGVLFASLTVCSGFAQEETDFEGSADHPLFTRMPGYYINNYNVKDSDRFEAYLDGPEKYWEGKMTYIEYSIKTGAKQMSMLQITRNYENALKKIGGKILLSSDVDGNIMEGKLEKNGIVTYVHVESFLDGRDYTLVILEKQAMRQDVVADAASLGASLASTGKATVQGLYFEGDQAVLKPESAPVLDQIVILLKKNPNLKVFVVGHTANVGNLESSLKLSQDRAEAIVKALVAKGIAANRLKAVGVGPYSPIASNKTEEGREQNRRVELVEQ